MPATALGPTIEEIRQAHTRIASFARHTPLERSARLSAIAGHDVFLKLECWQPTRSFKIRGAVNAIALLDDAQRGRGLVTASAGNHGQAVALAALHFGASATVFLPADAPQTKLRRIQSFGAIINQDCATYDEAEAAALACAAATGRTFIHAYSDRSVVAGQGTVALEILEDLPHVRAVVVPVGGGGLIAGMGITLKSADPAIRVLGVQSTATRAMYDAFEAGRPVASPIVATCADGLAGQVDEISYTRARAVTDAMTLVPENTLREALQRMYNDEGVVAEGAAAVAYAAITEHLIDIDGPTAVVITGANLDLRIA